MTTDSSTTPPLDEFAYRIAGPREFVICGAINAAVAGLVFWSADVVHLVGWHSVLMVSGPMFFILPWATTVTGYWVGTIQRRLGKFGNAWVEGTPWFGKAVARGLLRALIATPIGVGLIVLADSLTTDVTLGKWLYVALNGLVPGALGYVLHAKAIVQAGEL